MDSLRSIICGRINHEGPITFKAFMKMALYYPELGYYTNPKTEIGRMGDFATSSHLHPIFGAMVGRQAQEAWELMGRPGRFEIVEPGSGRGYLAKDLLDYLSGRDLYECISYTLIEINPAMQERQRALLRDHHDKIRWVQSVTGAAPIEGMIISNELIDALPVHLIEAKDGIQEIFVDCKEGRFIERPGPPSTGELAEYLKDFCPSGLPPGYRTEVNLSARKWIQEAASAIAKGFVMTIDYGYPARELHGEGRERGTLMCYHKHLVNEDPFNNIGAQDITAHINFSSLARWGGQCGLDALGFKRQGPYLVSMGIDEMISGIMARREAGFPPELARIKDLIMPGTMGDTHKVLIQCKGLEEGQPKLRGMETGNELKRLY